MLAAYVKAAARSTYQRHLAAAVLCHSPEPSSQPPQHPRCCLYREAATGTDPLQGELPCSCVISIQKALLLLWLWLLSFSSRPPPASPAALGDTRTAAKAGTGGSSSHTAGEGAHGTAWELLQASRHLNQPSEVIAAAAGCDGSTLPAPLAELLAGEGPAPRL